MMTALQNLLVFSLLGAYCIWLPGFLIARRFLKPTGTIETVSWSLGLGAAFMSAAGYSVGMLTHLFVGRWTFLAGATVVIVVLHKDLFEVMRHTRDTTVSWFRNRSLSIPGDRFAWLFLFSFTLIVLTFAANYDLHDLHATCVNYKVFLALGFDMGNQVWSSNELLSLPWGNRGGSPMEITIFPALFHFFGFHVSYVFSLTMIFLFGYLAAVQVVKNRFIALASAAFLSLSPLVLEIREIDQNLIGLSLAAMVFALALRARRSDWILGALFGLLVCVEHIMLVSAPAFLLLYRSKSQVRQGLLLFLAGAMVPLGVEGLNHYFAFGNVFHFENEADDIWLRTHQIVLPLFRHGFSFLEFEVNTLLNFPFHDQLVRSPYNAFPTFLLFPLHLLKSFGAVCVSISVLGFLSLCRRGGRTAAFLVLFCLPYLLILQFQENWSDLLKMRLIILFLMTPMISFAEGLMQLVSRRSLKVMIPSVVLLTTVLYLGTSASSRLYFPEDSRMYVLSPNLKPEAPEEHALEIEKYTTPRLLPALVNEHLGHSILNIPLTIPMLLDQLSSPRFEQHRMGTGEFVEALYEGDAYDELYRPYFGRNPDGSKISWLERPVDHDASEADGLVRYHVDLSELITVNKGWLRLSQPEETSQVLLSYPPLNGWSEHTNVRLNWVKNPLDIHLLRMEREGHSFALLALFLKDEGTGSPPRSLPGDAFEIEVDPDEHLSVIFLIHYRPGLMYFFDVSFREGELVVHGPTRN